jgi:hypothetical protein
VVAPPSEGAVEVGTRPRDVTELVPGHGQEEQVEGVACALAGREALLQGVDRLRIQAGAELGNTQRVEERGRAGLERDRLAGRGQGLLRLAQGDRAGGQVPRSFVVVAGVRPGRLGRPLPVGPGQLSVAQPIMGPVAKLVEARIIRVTRDQHIEVGQGLRESSQAERDLGAVGADVIPAGLGLEEPGEFVRGLGKPAEPERQQTLSEAGIGVVGTSRDVARQGRPRRREIVRLTVRLGQQEQGIGVVGPEPHPALQVGDGLGGLRQAEPQPAAVDPGYWSRSRSLGKWR